jgi:serine/threonine-protein kinase
MTESDEPYLVLELLRGENLEQRVRRHGALPLMDVLAVVTQTCDAIARAHAVGIVHRDVKPENVFLEAGPDISVKLLDFGVAKPTNKDECLEADRLPAGTVQYMSPEHMFDPETTDERSDLFSLAAVAYFALTRRPPYDAESLEALYFAIDGGNFVKPSERRPELPTAIDAWFERALAHAPEKRFASAAAMSDAFQQAVFAGRARGTLLDVETATFEEYPTGPVSISAVAGVPPALPRFRRRHAKKVATAALVVASAASLFAWHDGPGLPEANASASFPNDASLVSVQEPEPMAFEPTAPREPVLPVRRRSRGPNSEEAAVGPSLLPTAPKER